MTTETQFKPGDLVEVVWLAVGDRFKRGDRFRLTDRLPNGDWHFERLDGQPIPAEWDKWQRRLDHSQMRLVGADKPEEPPALTATHRYVWATGIYGFEPGDLCVLVEDDGTAFPKFRSLRSGDVKWMRRAWFEEIGDPVCGTVSTTALSEEPQAPAFKPAQRVFKPTHRVTVGDNWFNEGELVQLAYDDGSDRLRFLKEDGHKWWLDVKCTEPLGDPIAGTVSTTALSEEAEALLQDGPEDWEPEPRPLTPEETRQASSLLAAIDLSLRPTDGLPGYHLQEIEG